MKKLFSRAAVFYAAVFYIIVFSAAPADAGETLADIEARNKARETAESYSAAELASAVIMTGIDSAGTLNQSDKKILAAVKPAAVMLFRKNFAGGKEAAKNLVSEIKTLCDSPFIACDNEGGKVYRFTNDMASLNAPLSYMELARNIGEDAALKKLAADAERTASVMAYIGLNMNLAPVVEILNEKNRSFLGTRSYGTDAAWVERAAGVFIKTMSDYNIACVIKHFPGNSGADPHKTVPVLNISGADLLKENAVFFEIIRRREPAGVMVSHIIARAWDTRNSTLSPVVINEKLVKGGGFSGIVLADDFSMRAVSNGLSAEENCVLALAAGCDMVMAWAPSLLVLRKKIIAALESGSLKKERLIDAASKVLEQKARFGLSDTR